ncbi:127_t:CDS:2, partial [Acaulospora colombiana]
RRDSKGRADLEEKRHTKEAYVPRVHRRTHSNSLSPTRKGRLRDRSIDDKKKERVRAHRSRSRSTSAERDHSRRRHARKRHKRARSESSDSDDTESSDSSASASRQKKKKHKKRKSEKSEKKKKDKKKKRKEHKTKTLKNQWGKYGVIGEKDMHLKEEEFNLWLLEEKHLNVEEISPFMMKEYFKHFVEGALVDLKKDEEELRRQHRQQVRVPPPSDSLLTKDQVIEIKRVYDERVQAEKLRKMGFTPKE